MVMDVALGASDNRFIAKLDKRTGGWQIVDLKHESLLNMNPSDEIDLDHPSSTFVQAGAFVALIHAAMEEGSLENAETSKIELDNLSRERALQASKEETDKNEPATEKYHLSKLAMESLTKLALAQAIGDVAS